MSTTRSLTSVALTGPENSTRNFWLLMASGLLALTLLTVAPAAAGPLPGSLDVYTSPGGSSVCIDSNYCRVSSESTGMAYFSGLAVNQYHTITVTNYGFQTYTDTVYIDPYATNLVTSAILKPSYGNPGTIWVEIYPYGGTICMDGRDCTSYGPADYNGWTSVSYSDLAANQYHTLTVSLNGFQPYSQTIWMNPGGSMTLPDIRLQPLYR